MWDKAAAWNIRPSQWSSLDEIQAPAPSAPCPKIRTPATHPLDPVQRSKPVAPRSLQEGRKEGRVTASTRHRRRQSTGPAAPWGSK